MISLSLAVFSEVGFPDRVAVLFSVFWEITILCSTVAVLMYIPTNKVSPFSTSLPAFIFCPFDNTHSNQSEMTSYCSSGPISSWVVMLITSHICWLFVYLLLRNSHLEIRLCVLFLLLSFWSSLYILDINLCQMNSSQIFLSMSSFIPFCFNKIQQLTEVSLIFLYLLRLACNINVICFGEIPRADEKNVHSLAVGWHVL
jgi:hypothetical protein